jgi:hypothetical protein
MSSLPEHGQRVAVFLDDATSGATIGYYGEFRGVRIAPISDREPVRSALFYRVFVPFLREQFLFAPEYVLLYSTELSSRESERLKLGEPYKSKMNALFAIAPYKHQGFWVFDDAAVGLRQEPFVSGADRVLGVLTENIADADSGFKLVFAPQPFPGFVARFVKIRSGFDGWWYSWPERGMEGWLCPALFKYFESVPDELYVSVAPKAE